MMILIMIWQMTIDGADCGPLVGANSARHKESKQTNEFIESAAPLLDVGFG